MDANRKRRLASKFLLWVQTLLLLHAATPHAHASGDCGHGWAHAETETSWVEAVVTCVHDWIHHHEDSAACDDLDELFRPAETSRISVDRDFALVALPAPAMALRGIADVQFAVGRPAVPMAVLALRPGDVEKTLCWRGPPAGVHGCIAA